MKQLLTKMNTRRQTTDREKKSILGYAIWIFLVVSPFLFYLYRIAPRDSQEWNVGLFTINSGGFQNVSFFFHALFTKLILCSITTLWFFTCQNWWRYAILVPITMFLFQLTGVLNQNIEYIDEYDFWYSLPVVLPIIVFLVFSSMKIKKYTLTLDLKDEIDNEIAKMKNE